jgi:ABC-type branched-subunit amino acid transport system ATPase component/ABC-type branched-subunit amino acid transport system permease subunit
MSNASSSGMVPDDAGAARRDAATRAASAESSAELKRTVSIIAAGVVLYLGATWLISDRYYQLMFTIIPIWATVGVAWNIFSGYSGLMSFGHAAFFGIGAYTVALLLVSLGISPWFGIVAAGCAGAVSGVVIGLPTFRLRGHYFALAMLAYPLALLYVFEWLGYQEVALPMRRDAPAAYMQFADQRVYVLLAVVLLVVALAVNVAVARSRFGLSLLAIKQNEPAAMGAGINPRAWKLRAIALSGALTAMAGGLYAVVLLIVTPPSVFGMLASAQPLIVTLFGGIATVAGPVLGALILVPLGETLHAELGNRLPGIQGVVYGAAIIAVVLMAPEGILPRLAKRWGRNRSAAGGAPLALDAAPYVRPAALPAVSEAKLLLEVSGVSVRFGGLQALQNVAFPVRAGEILGIIGPNGAGKTTLFNALNGFISTASGSVKFEGRELAGEPPFEVCRAGVGRTFQVVRPFARLTLLHNVVVGAFPVEADDAQAYARAREAIRRVGLAGREGWIASTLTTVELRLMELARALAARPRLLLLDEILAGLGSTEIEHVLKVIDGVRREGVTVAIIEHTMHAMVRLADRLLVLDHGVVLAEGEPHAVTSNPAVIEAYLGKRWVARAGG